MRKRGEFRLGDQIVVAERVRYEGELYDQPAVGWFGEITGFYDNPRDGIRYVEAFFTWTSSLGEQSDSFYVDPDCLELIQIDKDILDAAIESIKKAVR